MARYIITDTQLHSVVYQYMDKIIDKERTKKQNPWDNEGYILKMYDKNAKNLLAYFWYAPGGAYDDDDDTVHNGVGSLQVHPSVVDFIRTMFKVRESKALDLVSDWVSTKIDTEVDEVTIYPERRNPPVY
jgi:hypothetical protein